MWNFHSASWWNSFIKFNKRAVVAGCWTLCDLEEGEQSAGSVDPSSGIISSSHPTGRKGGRALPGCGQPRIPASRSGDFLAPSGSAAGSHRWHAAGRVAGCREARSHEELQGTWMQKNIQQGHFLSCSRKSCSYVEAILQKSNTAQGEICLWVPM